MIRKAKTIEELYQEVKDYDLVITNDAPLNTALNKSIKKAHLGPFALTSKLIGTKYSNYLFEEDQLKLPQVVLKVQKKFNINLKESLFYLRNIFNIWQNIGVLEECKKYVSNHEKAIIEYLKELPSYQLSMEKMDLSFLEKNNIAVIGEELFTSLDKKVLTKDYDSIPIFKDEEHKLDTIYIFDSQKDIIDRIISMINTENQNGIAIVLNVESEYLSLIKARLINNNIDLNEKIFIFQDFRTREYLTIIESFFSLHNIHTKELIPIGTIFNINIDSKLENTLFSEISKIDSDAKELLRILNLLKTKTFGELVKELEKYDLSLPYKFTEVLYDLELFDEKIDHNKVLDLKYFIENLDQEIETSKKGVLLIDAKNSTYINREVIFYIGMDHTWVKNIDKQKFIDSKKELEKNIKSFEILIQQGKERFFFIPRFNQGNEVIPPYYFNFIFKTNIEKYSNDIFEIKEIKNNFEKKVFTRTPETKCADIKEIDLISNSTLGKFTQCPKKYSYSRLVSGPSKDFFLKGELVHAFAQFYVNYKEFVIEKDLEEFVDIIMNELKLLSNPLQNEILKTEIRLACISVIEFIDSIDIDESLNFQSTDKVSKKNEENVFSKHYNLPLEKVNAELEFKDLDLQLKGIIDLAVNNNLIVDYKTGKKKTPIDIIRKSNIKEIITKCDFQPLVYLSVFRKITPNKDIDFWYNFPMINTYEKIMKKDLEENTVKVHYISQSFKNFIQSDKFKEHFRELLGKDAKNIFEQYDSIHFFKDIDLTKELENKEEFIKKYSQNFIDFHLNKGLENKKKIIEHVSKLFNYIIGFKFGEKIGANGQKEAFFFKEDLDDFELFVKENIEKMNKYYKDRFPYIPIENENTCNECDFKKMCLKLGGEK